MAQMHRALDCKDFSCSAAASVLQSTRQCQLASQVQLLGLHIHTVYICPEKGGALD